MQCCGCFTSRSVSPENVKAKPATAAQITTLPSPGATQIVVGVERDGGGVTQPKRQAQFAHFQEVLKSRKAMAALREYMTSVQQAHMLDFLDDVEGYRSKEDDAARVKTAQTIFSSYLKVCADREVSLDKPVRDAIFSNLSKGQPQLFDAAERAVLEEIRRDVFPRFLETPLFERLAGLA